MHTFIRTKEGEGAGGSTRGTQAGGGVNGVEVYVNPGRVDVGKEIFLSTVLCRCKEGPVGVVVYHIDRVCVTVTVKNIHTSSTRRREKTGRAG